MSNSKEPNPFSQSIESCLFDCDREVDLLEDGVQFYNCTLKVQIGPYQPGQKVRCIALYYSRGTLDFFEPDPDGEDTLFYSHPVRLALA
jgi:hypothetical protein